MANHRGVKLCKAKGQYTENRTVNVRSFRYTRIWYTLWLVNFDRFCQHSSITDADELYDMAAVRDLSTSNAVFKSVINNTLKDFPKWSAFAKNTEGLYKNMVNERSLCNPSHRFLKEFNLSTLSTSNVSDDGMEKPAPSSRDHGGLSSSRGQSQQQQWVSTKKPRTGKCEIVCKDL